METPGKMMKKYGLQPHASNEVNVEFATFSVLQELAEVCPGTLEGMAARTVAELLEGTAGHAAERVARNSPIVKRLARLNLPPYLSR